jgi:hypothetical protein
MNSPDAAPATKAGPNPLQLRVALLLTQPTTYFGLGLLILVLDFFTGPFLLFPILFVIPVTLAAWFCSGALAHTLAILLPVGRFLIAWMVEQNAPLPFLIANFFIRVAVLLFISYLVARTRRQTRELERRVQDLVQMCAWSRTVEYQGEWLTFEQYLLRRFNINTTHGISPTEAKKLFGEATTAAAAERQAVAERR